MQEIGIQSLGREEFPELETATHSNIVAWEIPWTEKPRGATVHVGHKELDKTEYDWITYIILWSFFSFISYHYLNNGKVWKKEKFETHFIVFQI